MTAAVPDPRFRDQLAEALDDTATGIYMGKGWGATILDALMPVIAAALAAEREKALEGCAAWLERRASATLANDPFILASDWAAKLVREYAAEVEARVQAAALTAPVSEHLLDLLATLYDGARDHHWAEADELAAHVVAGEGGSNHVTPERFRAFLANRVQAAAINKVAVEDVRAIAVALGLGGHARPYSAHELVQREILPALHHRAAALGGTT